MTRFLNISGYKFVHIDNPVRMERFLRRFCVELGVLGTILIADEGVNVALSGEESAMRKFIVGFTEHECFCDVMFKESWSEKMNYRHMHVRIKPEIVTMKVPGVCPAERTGKHLSPKELKQWYDEGRDFVILDTRNDYEYRVGTFENAVNSQIENFREFPETAKNFFEQCKDKPLVMFCTGGIRCEKATVPYMDYGYQDVYQLHGGIIKYFDECGGAYWRGECFVFDDRVAVKTDLTPTDKSYCLSCLSILNEDDLVSDQFVQNQACPHCFDTYKKSA